MTCAERQRSSPALIQRAYAESQLLAERLMTVGLTRSGLSECQACERKHALPVSALRLVTNVRKQFTFSFVGMAN